MSSDNLQYRCLRAAHDASVLAAAEVVKARGMLAWAEAAEKRSLLMEERMAKEYISTRQGKNALDKQQRLETGVWNPATEMLDARCLLDGSVLAMQGCQFIPWIKAQFILTEEQVQALLIEKAVLAAVPMSRLRTG